MSRRFILKSLQEQKNLRVSRKAASTRSKAAHEGDCPVVSGTQGACPPPALKAQLHLLGIQEMAEKSMPTGGQKESVTPDFLKVPDFYFPQGTGEGFLLPSTCFFEGHNKLLVSQYVSFQGLVYSYG